MNRCEFGVLGLGTMGSNLALNLASRGKKVAIYNRTLERTREFVKGLKGERVRPTYALDEFTNSLEKPRVILVMVTAGTIVDQILDSLFAHLDKGDVVMDGGNSYFKDTDRRSDQGRERGIEYLGLGISGGEEGARRGACIMAGGSREGYQLASPVLRLVGAKLPEGEALSYLGPKGAGHFTKMVHNGIEYAMMQAMAEVYDTLVNAIGKSLNSITDIFESWKDEGLSSYLLEIAVEVLKRRDEEKGEPLLNYILDKAGQKGTGRWTSQVAMDLGVPTPTIDAAVSARNLSSMKDERVMGSRVLEGPLGVIRKSAKFYEAAISEEFVDDLRKALYCTFLVSYAQGMALLNEGSSKYSYDIPLKEVARIWRAGCIIRSAMLDDIWTVIPRKGKISNIMLYDEFARELSDMQRSWRRSLSEARRMGIACPALSASLDYYDSYRRDRLPANFIQALRDRFGAHGYERVDKPGTIHHTKWI